MTLHQYVCFRPTFFTSHFQPFNFITVNPLKSGLNHCLLIYESDVFRSSVAALWGQPLMLYGYLLNLNAFLNCTACRTEGTSSPGRRFRGHGILLAGPRTRPFRIRWWALLLGNPWRWTASEGCVKGRWFWTRFSFFLICITPWTHWYSLLIIGTALHCGTFFIAITLIVDTGENEHVENEENATNTNSDGESSCCAVVVSGSESLKKFCVVLIVIENIRRVISCEIFEGRGAQYRWVGYGFACFGQWWRDVPLVANSTWIINFGIFSLGSFILDIVKF